MLLLGSDYIAACGKGVEYTVKRDIGVWIGVWWVIKRVSQVCAMPKVFPHKKGASPFAV